MSKNKLLCLISVGIIAVLLLVLSSFSKTPAEPESSLQSESHVISGFQDESAKKHFIHPGWAKLQQTMRDETFRDTFYHLTNNDNLAMLIPMMNGRTFSPGVYESDILIVSKMTGVRKLLQEAQKNPEDVSAFLQTQLCELAEGYPQQYADFLHELNEAGFDGLCSKELPENKKTCLLCTVAVYILSQIGSDKALPVLSRISVQDEPGGEMSRPVNPKFLYYAMHRIIQKSQTVGDSGKFSGYLEKAKTLNIHGVKPIAVTAWDADFHEDDFQRILPDRELDLNLQPTIKLELFPSLDHISKRKAEMLLAELRELIG